MEKDRPLAIFAISALFMIFVVTCAWFKQNGFLDVQKLQMAIEKTKSEIDAKKAENNLFRVELSSLNHSDRYVEAIARENLGLVKPNEVVYEFVEPNTLNGGRIDTP
ncbi:hypothetical protein MNBD_NITROSPINAE01-647 [hydrothermal vent metagenome]|uniref:Cell division protein DivIC (FtsB), stabilizes FtsL against RasP cleavage n=1 Tax=hydrothermal vent metagenome TaxID=652676 RepID=A0A3B1BZR0_9ZZZZ